MENPMIEQLTDIKLVDSEKAHANKKRSILSLEFKFFLFAFLSKNGHIANWNV